MPKFFQRRTPRWVAPAVAGLVLATGGIAWAATPGAGSTPGAVTADSSTSTCALAPQVGLTALPTSITSGSSSTLTAQSIGATQNLSISGADLSSTGLATPALATATANPTDPGVYTYSVTATNGTCSSTATATLTVTSAGGTTTTTTSGSSTTLCLAPAVTLSSLPSNTTAGAPFDLNAAGSPTNSSLVLNGPGLNDVSLTPLGGSLTLAETDPGSYTFTATATNSCGTSIQRSTTVTVTGSPVSTTTTVPPPTSTIPVGSTLPACHKPTVTLRSSARSIKLDKTVVLSLSDRYATTLTLSGGGKTVNVKGKTRVSEKPKSAGTYRYILTGKDSCGRASSIVTVKVTKK